MNNKVTTDSLASLAAMVLHDQQSSETARRLAGSALSQVNRGNETTSNLAALASQVLTSNKYSEITKELAGSVLSLADKNR